MGIENLNCLDTKVETYRKLNSAIDALNTTADMDLSNLSNLGQAKFDEKAYANEVLKKNQITNCILECPQEISSDNTIADPNDTYRGIGYIGSTIWIDKGLKYLIPKDRNADGTLNNIEITTTKFYSRTLSTLGNGTWALLLTREGGITTHRLSACSYDFNNNHNLVSNNEVSVVANLGSYTITDGVITEFNVQKPIRLASYEETVNLSNLSDEGKNTIATLAQFDPYSPITIANPKSYYQVPCDCVVYAVMDNTHNPAGTKAIRVSRDGTNESYATAAFGNYGFNMSIFVPKGWYVKVTPVSTVNVCQYYPIKGAK